MTRSSPPHGSEEPLEYFDIAAMLATESAFLDTADIDLSTQDLPEEEPKRITDRYVLVKALSEGGMGVAYVARDEKLDRDVVIKLVRPDLPIGRWAPERLRKEAQALARLAHPNIVTVYDVGVHDGRPFIAMEFVHGLTLGKWLLEKTRDLQEIVSVFSQVATGLLAAHQAGVVHRDVKPANIVVGYDGRVRVLDFGIALLTETEEPAASSDPLHENDLGDRLTKAGALMGTLPFMAPEQLKGDPASELSDQFSFCLCLFLALYNKPPFPERGLLPRHEAMKKWRLEDVPKYRTVPRWLREIVGRGLAYDPNERWPSMDTVLAALTKNPDETRRRRLKTVASSVAVGLVATLGTWGLLRHDSERIAGCTHPGADLSQTWDAQRKQTIKANMLQIDIPYAQEAWRRTEITIDRYAETWTKLHEKVCQAADRRALDPAQHKQRLRCLAERRRNLDAFTQELARVDAETLPRVLKAAKSLPPIRPCDDQDYLDARVKPPTNLKIAAQVETEEKRLMQAKERMRLGKIDSSIDVAAEVLSVSKNIGHPPLIAKAHFQLGQLHEKSARFSSAETHLREAYFLAREHKDKELAFLAATELVLVVGRRLSRFSQAHDWVRHAKIEGLRQTSPLHHARLLNHVGLLHYSEGEYAKAEAPLRKALHILPGRAELDSQVRRAETLNLLGNFLWRQARYPKAIEHYRRAIAIYADEFGPMYPKIGIVLNNIGASLEELGRYPEAAEHFRNAVEISMHGYGATHPYVAEALANLGSTLGLTGDLEGAVHHCRQSERLFVQSYGRVHQKVARPLYVMAWMYLENQKAHEALPIAEEALEIRTKAHAPPVNIAEASFATARALAKTGQDPSRARELARQAKTILQETSAVPNYFELDTIETWLAAHSSDRTFKGQSISGANGNIAVNR